MREIREPICHRTHSRLLVLAALWCACMVAQPAYGVGHGPGLGKVTFSSTELNRSIFQFPPSIIGNQLSMAAMHNGYLFVPSYSSAGGRLTTWNVSNPRQPVLVKQANFGIFKSHGMAFFGNLVTVRGGGTMIFDLTDMAAPRLVSRFSGKDTALWSHWTAPYLYTGGEGPSSSQPGRGGVTIWNASNPASPTQVKYLDMTQLVGFPCGSVNVVGNLMVISGSYDAGHVLLDASDPVNPVILDVIRRSGFTTYTALVNGGRLYNGSSGGGGQSLSIYDLRNPLDISLLQDVPIGTSGQARYVWIQDNFAHLANRVSNRYLKVDINNFTVATSAAMPGHNSDIAVPFGNWTLVGQNLENTGAQGAFVVPHQAAPDNRGPEVNMVNPMNGAIRRALTSRVGITLTDQIDTRTVNSSTFIIRPLGGAALGGRYTNQLGILNFFPNSPLAANTTYEVIVPAGGLKDVSGNVVTVPFRSLFSTGATVSGSPVVTPPTITTQPISRTVTAGQTATFSVVAQAGSAPLTYQWQKNAVNISGATAASYTTPATTIADNGATFRVIVSSSVTSNSATLTVNSAATAPAITTQPASRSVTAGQTATFSVVASGTAPLAYQWQKNSVTISGATGASYTTPATTLADNGASYRVVVSNSVGTVTSNSATLTVTSAATAPAITTQPASRSVTAGQTAAFSVAASGTAPLAYQWQKNAVNISGATGASYTTPATALADNGATFRVLVSNSVGSVTSASATLTVTQAAMAGTIPAPWQQQDVGSVGLAGSASHANGTFTVRGAGDDIWYSADAFRFVFQPLTGDGQIVARVSSVQNTDPWAKAGVMIRETLSPQSKHAMLVVTPANGVSFQWRAAPRGASSFIPGSNAAPYWVRLVRSGNTFTGYKSANGSTWVQVGSATIAMASTVSIGLSVTAHNNAALCTATIDNVSVTANTTVATSGGLTGQYFDNVNFTGASISRTDAEVNFNWGLGSPASSIGADTFSARWTGQVLAQHSQTYTFYVTGDDGVRLWVNGSLLIDKWILQSATEWSGTIALVAGTKYDIRLEYFDNELDALAQLRWSSASTPKAIIPTSQLYPSPAAGTGLTGQYFDNGDFTGANFTRTDATVNFDWGQGSPAAAIGVDTFSARWTGQVQAQYSQTYTFHVTGDDGIRLWVNGSLLIDKWIIQAATEHSASIALMAGVKYDIRLDYYENLGFTAAQLRWSSASTPKAIVPTSQLYPALIAIPVGTG